MSEKIKNEIMAAEKFIGTSLCSFPTAIVDRVKLYWFRFAEAAALADISIPEDIKNSEQLFKVWAYSEFVAEQCIRCPEMLLELVGSGDLDRCYEPQQCRKVIDECLAKVDEEDDLLTVLRTIRNREMVRVAWRDLSGKASLDEVMQAMSALADACIAAALQKLHDWHCADYGTPNDSNGNPQSLIVLAMGKLGACELNFSSDIDLIFAYPAPGETVGVERAISNEKFFVGLGRRLINVLNKSTAEGFVFRVDMRLRPYGDSGSLVMCVDAMETYYQSQGRDWERYAMIKARAVAGDQQQGLSLIKMLRPFVYRRYLDFGSIEALREMKAMIDQEVQRKGLLGNIKLGPGGIREIEFIGQVFQLIRGGRELHLQEPAIQKVLKLLVESGHLAKHIGEGLQAAYIFLRRTENRLQEWKDEQTHSLPDDALGAIRLARSMGFCDERGFAEALGSHLSHVQEGFEQIFSSPQLNLDGTDGEQENTGFAAIWIAMDQSSSNLAQNLVEFAEFNQPEEALRRLKVLHDGAALRAMSRRGRNRLNKLMPLLLGAVIQTANPDETLPRLLNLLEAIVRRTAYLDLLMEYPLALSQLVRLCSASPWLSALLAGQPVLLDELLDSRALYAPLQSHELAAQLQLEMADVEANDLEAQMDQLRYFKHEQVLRVAAADLADVIPVTVVSDYLTGIAEVILLEVLNLVNKKTFGEQGLPLHEAGFAVIAYGKFGGFELGYGSDIDLVFLHDDQLEHSVNYTRLGQRLIHMLTAYTAAGRLYEVDMRLRPSGSSGLLVSGIASYEDYQLNQAWTWEHQSLVRARFIAGDARLAQRFNSIRRQALEKERPRESLRQQVIEMRERMRNELDASNEEQFDVKQGLGGIADIEFIVQYFVLAYAVESPELIEWTDNIRLLEVIAKLGLLSNNDVECLIIAYQAYRACVHQLALQEQLARVPVKQFFEYRRNVSTIWQRLLEV